jgi:hypothetical protein
MTPTPSATTTAASRFGHDTSYGAGSPEAPIRGETMQAAAKMRAAPVQSVQLRRNSSAEPVTSDSDSAARSASTIQI